MMSETTLEYAGLTDEEVRERTESGRVNEVTTLPSRTIGQILRANLFTRFNAILGALLIVVAVVGPPQDGLFGVVLVVNAAIGAIQEVRSKRALDHLALLSAPVAHVIRNGIPSDQPTTAIVEDDVIELRPGDQIVADANILRSLGLQVDESLLSGEALPVDKVDGDDILSGSIVVSGSGHARVTHVGADAYAQRLQIEAKQFQSSSSELQRGTNQILRIISWVILPVGAVLATSQLVRLHIASDEALRGTVAGVGAMVPEGLVLLTTMAFALGALRLARHNVLVQSLPAVEGLARVDVVCIDKTGTLTAQGMVFDHAVALKEDISISLGSVAGADPTPNATMQAIAAAYPVIERWQLANAVPFSSERKWSAFEFVAHGTWVLGAPDVLFSEHNAPRLFEAVRDAKSVPGSRVLVLASSDFAVQDHELPDDLCPMGIVVLNEEIRADAKTTVQYLLRQNVKIKVISGDDPITVAAIARSVGIAVDEPYDARDLPESLEDLTAIAERATVFGRVRPDQKRAIVEALQRSGHVVAMTGDGVNDVPALKRADIGIAMGSGSQASRAVANIVLLNSAFAAVPHILDEGRRVISNIERVANLFVTKTVYASILALVAGATAIPYPFYPRQLTVVSSLTIGIPGFFLALAPGAPRAKPHFLRRIMRFSVPAGIGVAIATLVTYGIARWPQHASTTEAKTAAAVALFAIAIFVLAMLARPLHIWRLLLVITMAGGGVIATVVPLSQRIFSISIPPTAILVTVALVTGPVIVVLWLLLWSPSRPVPARRLP